MAQLNFPSMFDTRHAMDRQMQEDAHKAGMAAWGGKRYGMYYNSSLLGDQDIARKRSVLGMFGLGGDPRMQQQQALDEIMAKFPNPQTPQDFIEIANALGGVGLHSYAEAAMDMANDIRSSQPAKSNAWKEYTEMTSNPTPQGFKIWYDKYKVTTGKGGYKEVKTEDPITGVDIIETYQIGADGLIVPNSTPVFTRTVDKASSTATDPETIAKQNKMNQFISESAAKLRLQPEWQNATDEQILTEAKTIGSNLFLEWLEEPSASEADYSTNIDDFLFYDAKRQAGEPDYKDMTDDDIRELIALQKPTSPQNVLINQNREFNREAIQARQEVLKQDAYDANVNLAKTNQMLQAYEMGAKSGWGAEWLLRGQQVAEDFFGMPVSNKRVATEVLESYFKAYTLDAMAKLKGTPSDKDLDTVEASVARINRGKDANMIIIKFDAFQQQEKINQQSYMANWFLDYVNKNGEHPSGALWDLKIESFRNRGDENKFVGTEDERQRLIAAYGNNEFGAWEDHLKILDLNKSSEQIAIEQQEEEQDAEAAADALLGI
jgi:hypothetical protein